MATLNKISNEDCELERLIMDGCHRNNTIDRSFQRVKKDVVFTLCAIIIVQGLLTIMLVSIV